MPKNIQNIQMTEKEYKNFTSLIQLKLELFDYINWYNKIRIHSTLNYLTPVNYQKQKAIQEEMISKTKSTAKKSGKNCY